jgi:hypothetical protein
VTDGADGTDGRWIRKEVVVGLIGLVFATAGVGVKLLIDRAAQGSYVRLSGLTVTPETRGQYLTSIGLPIPPDEQRAANDAGTRIEAKVAVRGHQRLDVECELATSSGRHWRHRLTWTEDALSITPCWIPLPDRREGTLTAWVRVFPSGERREALEKIGPEPVERAE